MADSKTDTKEEKQRFPVTVRRLFNDEKKLTGWQMKIPRASFVLRDLEVGQSEHALEKRDRLYTDLRDLGLAPTEEMYRFEVEVTPTHVFVRGRTETAVRNGLVEYLEGRLDYPPKVGLSRRWTVSVMRKEEGDDEDVALFDLFDDEEF